MMIARYKSGSEVLESERVKVQHRGGRHALTIKQVNMTSMMMMVLILMLLMMMMMMMMMITTDEYKNAIDDIYKKLQN